MEQILYNAILSKIQKQIKENKEEIEKLKTIDEKYCKIKFDINDFLKIIENYKNKKIENKEQEKIIYCNGNPYIIINLSMISILKNIRMKINIENNMLGVNKIIIQIINNAIKENSLKNKIEIIDELENKENVIFIDRINDYNILKKQIKNAKFIPYEMIEIYSNEEEYEELFEKIYNYAIEQNIDIDIFDEEEGIESLIKYGKSNNKLILTNNKQIIEKYKNKGIYVNENPLKNKEIIFNEEMINKIID